MRLPLDDQVQSSPGSIEMLFVFPSGNTADRELFDEKESPVGLVDDGYVTVRYVGTAGVWRHAALTARSTPAVSAWTRVRRWPPYR